MADYSTQSVNLGRFDKSAGVPDLERGGPDMGEANRYKGIADMLGTFAKSGGDAYAAKVNRDRRDEDDKRRKEIEARQEKNRKENEARIEAERIYTETGGAKSWKELTEEEQKVLVSEFHGPDKSRAGWNRGATGDKRLGTWKRDQGEFHIKTVKKGKYLDSFQKNNQYLKEAYQQKRTEAVLTKQQADWDKVAPNLVDKVYDEWRDQRNDKDPVTGQQIGETDFTKYAVGKLEVYKIERAQQHFLGLPMLGEARKNVRLNDDNYLSMVAKRKQEYVDELTDKDIQAGLDTHLTGDSPLTDLSNPDKIDALIDHISTLGPEGVKVKNPNGSIARIHDRDAVQFQLIDDIDNKLTIATSSNDPVFKIIKAFTGENEKAGRMMMERRGGIGTEWEKVLNEALKKKLALQNNEDKISGSLQKQNKEKAKIESSGILLNVSEALDYQTFGVGTHTENWKNTESTPILKEDGTIEGRVTKVQALALAYSNLLANKKAFEDGLMSREYLEMKDKLVIALNKEDPTNSAFDAPNSELAKNAENNFRANISELNEKALEKLRVEVNQESQNQPWLTLMKHKVIDEIYADLTDKRTREKQQLAIESTQQTIEKNKIEKGSSNIKRQTLSSFRDNTGKVLSLDKLISKRGEIETKGGLTDTDSISLLGSIDTLIDRQRKSEGFKTDSGVHKNIFNSITTLGPDGKLKTVKELETLRDSVLNHTWTNETQKNSLLTLIQAASGKSGDFKRELKKQNDQTEHKKKIRKLTLQTDTDIQDLIAKVSLPKGHKDKLSSEEGKTKLTELKTKFFKTDGSIALEIAKGELLNVDINHEERFLDARATILGLRTDQELADAKDDKEDAAAENTYERNNEASRIRLEIAAMMDDPLAKVILAGSPGFTTTESNLDKVMDLVNTTYKKINKNGTVFDGDKEVSLFTPTQKTKIITDFKIKVKERKAPATVSESTTKVQAFSNIQEIKTLTGSDRQKAIVAAENYLKTQYLDNKLSGPDLNNEKSILHQIAKDGKVKTKPAYQTGEDHIRSLFAGHSDKFLSNAFFLPKNEDGKLYNELSKAFNRAWTAKAGELQGEKDAVLMAEAIKLAETFTKVYPNPDNHPINPDINRRLTEYQMPTQELSDLFYERQDLEEERLRQINEPDGKQEPEKIKLNKPKMKSQFRRELSRDTRQTRIGRPIGILGAIIEEISTIGTDTDVDWIPIHSHTRQSPTTS